MVTKEAKQSLQMVLILCVENPKHSTHTKKPAGYKVNTIKVSSISIHWQWTIWKEIKKIILYTVAPKKNKIPRNKINQGGERLVH